MANKKKTAAKKIKKAVKKSPAKKAVKKPVKKVVKKSQAKAKAPAKKTTAKKVAPKKSIQKKPATKKNAKPLAKKSSAPKKEIAVKQTKTIKAPLAGKSSTPKLNPAVKNAKRNNIISMPAKLAPKQGLAKKLELPQGYKPVEKEEYMNPQQLEYFRRKLDDWKKDLLQESTETIQHLQAETWNEPDPSDQATIVEQTGLELRTRDRYRKLIAKIDAALNRIEIGEYGYCEITGEPIGIKRLEARPIATMTIAAQEQHEMEEKMSLEG